MNEQQTNALFNCKRIVPTVSTDSCVWIEKRMWEYFLVSHNQSGSIPPKCLTMLSQQIIKSSLNCDQMSPRILWLKRAKKFNAWSQTEVPAWLDCSPMMPGCRSERLLPPRHRRAGWDGLMHQDDQRPKRPKPCATKWHASWSTESRPGPRGKGWYEMIWTRREHPKSADFLTIPDFGDEKLLPAGHARPLLQEASGATTSSVHHTTAQGVEERFLQRRCQPQWSPTPMARWIEITSRRQFIQDTFPHPRVARAWRKDLWQWQCLRPAIAVNAVDNQSWIMTKRGVHTQLYTPILYNTKGYSTHVYLYNIYMWYYIIFIRMIETILPQPLVETRFFRLLPAAAHLSKWSSYVKLILTGKHWKNLSYEAFWLLIETCPKDVKSAPPDLRILTFISLSLRKNFTAASKVVKKPCKTAKPKAPTLES